MTDKSKTGQPRYAVKAPSRGGARAGAGRPRGSTTKIRFEDLLGDIELQAGKTYSEILAHNYMGAISRSDWNGVRDYDKAFMNKLIADKTEITTTESADLLEQRQLAFAAAIAQITGRSIKD